MATIDPFAEHSVQWEKVRQQFAADVATHDLAVLQDVGAHRHLRMARPDTAHLWYELVTWPSGVAVTGTMGSYLFTLDVSAGQVDMMDLLRSGEVDPAYWAGLAAGGKPSVQELAKERLYAYIDEAVTDEEQRHDGFRDAVSAWVICGVGTSQMETADSARAWLGAFEEFPDFRFDTDGWDLLSYTPAYLWCCCAMQHAVQTYDRQRAGTSGS
ncbi:hypothetical protein [Streptomyces sp. NPDC047968]|uniref:hypothetical protein n=1 Tax=unclassified Streptomyces TaxID=2593676 RepID=UPI00341B70D4